MRGLERQRCSSSQGSLHAAGQSRHRVLGPRPVPFQGSNLQLSSRNVQPCCRQAHTPSSQRRLTCTSAGIDLDALAMPEIDGDIKSLQVEMDALFSDDGLATTFQNKAKALQALETGVVLHDRSHWGRIRLAGRDRMTFLQNQSTADFSNLRPGQGCDTVFVTATGRCLEVGTVLVNENSVIVLVTPETKDTLLQRFDKYIFPTDDVKVQDISSRTAMITLLGPDSDNVLRELGGDAITVIGKPPGSHQLLGFRGKAPLIISVGTGLSVHGYTLIVDETVAGDVYAVFAGKGAIPIGEDDWEAARVLDGRAKPGAELTDAYNPLEAGLYRAVSLNKGCYIGQETLAKLHLRDGVKQQLWGLQLNGPVQPGTDIYSEMNKVGVVTSTCQDADGNWVGLGYIRCRLGGAQVDLEGVKVAVSGMPATVTPIPYATRTFSSEAEPPKKDSSAAGSGGDTLTERAAEAKQKKSEAKADEDAAKAARLKAMEERLAAWQASQAKQQQQQQQ